MRFHNYPLNLKPRRATITCDVLQRPFSFKYSGAGRRQEFVSRLVLNLQIGKAPLHVVLADVMRWIGEGRRGVM